MQENKRIYVAGEFARKQRIKEYIEDFQRLGYEITHDWTKNEGSVSDRTNKNFLQQNAANDINGVTAASALVVIMDNNNYEYRGTWTEIGCALGSGFCKPVFIYMPEPENNACVSNIFLYHENVHIFTKMELLHEALDKHFSKPEEHFMEQLFEIFAKERRETRTNPIKLLKGAICALENSFKCPVSDAIEKIEAALKILKENDE
jgi:nucleoside 2-deoxyribosyltransferase